MDVLTILSTLLRRWLIVVAVLVLTGVAVAGIVVRTEPTYEMRGSFLAAERVMGEPGISEPNSEFGEDAEEDGSTAGQVAAVLNPGLIAEAVQDGAVAEEIRAQGGTSGYEIQVEGDLLRVVASHSDRSKVVPTVLGVLAAIEGEVAAVQAEVGIPQERQAVVERIAVPSEASVKGHIIPNVGVEYSARGAVRIAGPGVGGDNPYTQSGFTVEILEEVLGGEAARARVIDAGGTGDYSIDQEDDETAPIVYLTATGASADEAERTFAAARDVASDELETRQAALGAPEASRIGLFALSVPSRAQQASSGLARPLITVAGLGAATAVGLALLVDNVLYGLRRRREDAAADAATVEGNDESDGDVTQDGAGHMDVDGNGNGHSVSGKALPRTVEARHAYDGRHG